MHHFNRYLISASAILAFIGLSTPAGAALVQFTYTGNPFTNISGNIPVSNVIIQLTVDDMYIPRNGRAVLDSYNSKNLNDFYFSDGYRSLVPNDYVSFPYAYASVSFDTDINGNVSGNWDARSGSAHAGPDGQLGYDFGISTLSFSKYGPQGAAFSEDSTHANGPWIVNYNAVVANNPGTWTRTTTPVHVPQPAAVWLMSTGLLGLLGFNSHRRVNA